MKEINVDMDVYTFVKLERRASRIGMNVEEYVEYFFENGVEPIPPPSQNRIAGCR